MFCRFSRKSSDNSALHPRDNTQCKIIQPGLFAAAAMAVAMAAAGPASADYGGASANLENSLTIEVESDGENYTKTAFQSPSIQGEMAYSFNAGLSGKILMLAVWPSIKAEGMDGKAQFHNLGIVRTYPLGDRPWRVKDVFPFHIAPSYYNNHVKAACNTLAERLRTEEGMTNEEIFAVDRTLSLAVLGDHIYQMSGIPEHPNVGEVSGPPPEKNTAQILCAKSPSSGLPSVAEPVREKPKVSLADLKVVGNDSNAGACSVSLVATLRTEAPNTEVEFRFESEDGQTSDLKTLVTPGNAFVQKGYEYPLPAGGTKSGQIRMVIEGESTTSDWEDYEVQCGLPLQTLLPPEAVLLEVGATAREVVHKGRVCPAEVKIIGGFKGRGAASGTAVLAADGKMNELKPFSIEGSETKYIDGEYDLSWENVQGPLRQELSFTLSIANAEGVEVDKMTKTQTFACRRSTVADDGGAAVRFAIQAPKGTIKSGQIRLSGGKANTKYVLRFYRKAADGYQRVRSAQLPSQMTGSQAAFKLAALTGGRSWRLQVCPLGSKGTKGCKTSDFRIARVGAAGKPPAPGAQGEAKVFILPGQGG